MIRIRLSGELALFAFSLPGASGLGAQDDRVVVRVVDVGSGACTVTRAPGEHYMVSDAGHWEGQKCNEAAREFVEGDQIDLLIISHSDADHPSDAEEILEEYAVQKVIRAGYDRWDRANWRRMNDAIGEEARYGATLINLCTTELEPGEQLDLRPDATVTLRMSALAGLS